MTEDERPSGPTPGGPKSSEPEHQGSIWSHPYMIYVWGTILLFAVLLTLGWLALQNDWIPSRGVHS